MGILFQIRHRGRVGDTFRSASVRLKFDALKGQLIPAQGNPAETGAALVSPKMNTSLFSKLCWPSQHNFEKRENGGGGGVPRTAASAAFVLGYCRAAPPGRRTEPAGGEQDAGTNDEERGQPRVSKSNDVDALLVIDFMAVDRYERAEGATLLGLN